MDELNKYACDLEEKYINARTTIEALYNQLAESNQVLQSVQEQVLPHYQEVAEKHDLMRQLLLDPDLLAQWTLTMIGDDGIYAEPAQYRQPRQEQIARQGFPAMQAQAGYAPTDGWAAFENAFAANPYVAYQYLDRIPAHEVQQRQLVGLS